MTTRTEHSQQVVSIFDEWYLERTPDEKVMLDEWLDKLQARFRHFGIQSAKELLAHTLCRVQPMANAREK